ncbi:MAG: 16S rRNA (cytidine(1402)-2'-O)-methyltransferase [Syntrophales bacterium]|nr:16S rRNA (cytidine(1402)-2'-O)-methyltransferase [Syntrophales bacterium]MDD4339467.1 16S rRNA (cytidine(1402)-2'-O)-methyltransferase [Syntrophales bacterium]HOG08453.1 16S rRNA (cytidine(1402)-2'-O)-methyltransferase [Syntrophales bacterium]HOS76865.1 16S rRNA (cytidine(1402)-2'-O)-methyltransferase [Syntrophales bacterium]HPB70379.1 16S rRNA (cytidine(1402)-2'-O)-methyltransferase [Syntrophales bacterium]
MNPQGNRENGCLFIVGTPIGNLEDITLRAIRVLKEVRLVAAEDTRHSRKLLAAHGITTPLISLHEHNEAARAGLLLGKLQAGQDVAYISDAGTPAISDPGARLVRAALAAGVRVVPVPGASAVASALSVSGFSADAFLFAGFLPARAAARRLVLAALKGEPRTLVFYESPRRLTATLKDLAAVFGDREAVLCRELTKVFEEVLRGPLSALAAKLETGAVRGEVTLVVAGSGGVNTETSVDAADLREMAARLAREGLSRRDRVEIIARETGLPRRLVYQKIGLET